MGEGEEWGGASRSAEGEAEVVVEVLWWWWGDGSPGGGGGGLGASVEGRGVSFAGREGAGWRERREGLVVLLMGEAVSRSIGRGGRDFVFAERGGESDGAGCGRGVFAGKGGS